MHCPSIRFASHINTYLTLLTPYTSCLASPSLPVKSENMALRCVVWKCKQYTKQYTEIVY